MTEVINQPFPIHFNEIQEATVKTGFTMASDTLTCSLLRTLAASKTNSRFLELGTGTGLSTAWILDGMDDRSSLISVDNEEKFLKVAKEFLGHDHRLQLVCKDGGEWIADNSQLRFDFIFADTWHGKYLLLEEVLAMVNSGGFYIIDDMLAQPNWPEGHDQKVNNLINYLEARNDFLLTRMEWASGIIVGVKK